MSLFSLLSRSLLVSVVLALSACASADRADAQSAATAPLNDLNLIQDEIPVVLLEARSKPYLIPADSRCYALAAEIVQLDQALGADIDVVEEESDTSVVKRGSRKAKRVALGALRSTTEGVVPFRSWVRKLTGAERYSKKAAEAIAAGMVRRGFLKGVSVSKGC